MPLRINSGQRDHTLLEQRILRAPFWIRLEIIQKAAPREQHVAAQLNGETAPRCAQTGGGGNDLPVYIIEKPRVVRLRVASGIVAEHQSIIVEAREFAARPGGKDKLTPGQVFAHTTQR